MVDFEDQGERIFSCQSAEEVEDPVFIKDLLLATEFDAGFDKRYSFKRT